MTFIARWKKIVVGQQFGQWTVTASGVEGFTCACSCGVTKDFDSDTASNLLLGKSTACSRCRARKRHRKGISGVYASIIPGLKLRQSWLDRYSAMVSRCTNAESLQYPDYGGRGIRVGPSFDTAEKYLRYIVTLPGWDQPWAELDRTENDKGYEVGNVRIVTHAVNQRNTRRTLQVTHNGETLCATDFWLKYCPRYRGVHTITRKLRAGYSLERIIAEQVQCHGARKAS